MTVSLEETVSVVAAIAATGLPGSLTEVPVSPLPTPEWAAVLAQVRRSRLGGHLMDAIQIGGLAVTERQLAQAVDLHRQAMARVLMLEETLLDVVTVLEGHDIDVRVLKGPAIAHLDYPDPASRVFGDVDLLVAPTTFPAAVSVLLDHDMVRRFPEPRRGFDERFTKGACLIAPNGDEVDLHRTLVLGPFGLRIDIEDLWAGPGQTFEIGGRTLVGMDPSIRLLHACYRGVLGSFPPRLNVLRDIAQLLLGGAVDAGRVRELAANWRGEAVLAAGLKEAWRTLRLADEVALSVWAEEYQPDRRSTQELGLYMTEDANYTRKSIAAVRALPTLRDKIAYVRALLLPDREYVTSRYPGYAARLQHAIQEARSSEGNR